MPRDNHPGAVDPINKEFASRLEQGLVEARKRAAAAKSFADYRRAVRYYVNNLREGHVALKWTAAAQEVAWPGFVLSASAPGTLTISVKADDVPLPVGAQLKSCDGKDVNALLEQRTDPYFWNADIPHARYGFAAELLSSDASDAGYRLGSCTFLMDGKERIEKLTYRNDSAVKVNEFRAQATVQPPKMGISKRGDLWFVSIPNLWNDAAVKALLEEFEAKLPELRKGIVVFDVRGNGGGNSGYGNKLVQLFWGAYAAPYLAGLDNTFEARVSPTNIAHVRLHAKKHAQPGLEAVADKMQQALQEGRLYARFDYPPRKVEGPVPPNPVEQKVYFLTDEKCASACLNFADVVRQIPGVTHVGKTTGADAIYIDLVGPHPLPSGLATLSYSYKVYRRRARGHNQSYEPQIKWPGGVMTDDAVAQWISAIR